MGRISGILRPLLRQQQQQHHHQQFLRRKAISSSSSSPFLPSSTSFSPASRTFYSAAVKKRGKLMARLIASNLIRSQTTHLITKNVSLGCNSFRLQTPALHPTAELHSTSSILATLQKRWASNSPRQQDDSKISIGPRRTSEIDDKDSKDPGVAYIGPISTTIRKVKLLSLSTCCLSVSLGPVITFMTLPDMNVILKGGMAATVMFLSATTTAALHWFVSPYVHKIRWQPGSDSCEVEMMSWLATPIKKTIKFSDVRVAETNRPYVSFMANGDFYYVDPDQCPNKALLAKLSPHQSSQKSAFKNL